MSLPADQQHSFRFCTTMLSVYDADGFLGVQPDVDGMEGGGLTSGADAEPEIPGGGAPDYEWIAPYGSIARHADPVVDASGNPDAANAGLTLVFYEGGRGYGFQLTDPRTTALLPPVEKGSHWLYAANGISGLMIRGAGKFLGDVTMVTTSDGTPGGQTVQTANTPTAHRRIGPWGAEVFDPSGYHITAHDSSWQMHFGSVGGFPGPAAQLGNYGYVQAAAYSIVASIINLGVPGPTGAWPVVIENPVTIAKDAAVLATLEAVVATISALASSTGPCTSPALPTLVSAVQALATAIQAATLKGVSTSVCAT